MALTFEPLFPWQWVTSGLAAAVVMLLLVRGLVDGWRPLGRGILTRFSVLSTSILAAGCFVIAAFNPLYVDQPDPDRSHLVVLADVSESIQRAEGGWPQVHEEAAQLIGSSIEALPEAIRTKSTASVLTFGEGVVLVEKEVAMADLPTAFRRLNENDFARKQGSDIEAGLQDAARSIQAAGGRGAVLLISDGNQTEGNALRKAQQLAQQGVAIHVLPISSSEPALAITAADLPRQVKAETETFVRGTVRNQQTAQVVATVAITRNMGLTSDEGQFGPTLDTVTNPFSLDINETGRLRSPLQFEGLGLQFVDLVLTAQEGAGTHHRRFFTHVNRPLEVLAIGGDNRWTAALPSGEAKVTEMTPSQLTATTKLQDFDVVTISNVVASEFSPAALAHVARSVEEDGLGFLLINGGHQGLAEDTETVLMSYLDTVIDPLLPVSSEPRPFQEEPPPRQVVFVMDVSGSMDGPNLTKSQEIARHIIETFLRPQDRLDVLLFGGGTQYLIKGLFLTDSNKQQAIRAINSIQAGGGSDPNGAMMLLERERKLECGLIFISDGEIVELSSVNAHPDCRATVFAIGKSSVPANSPLHALSDPFPVTNAFDPKSIQIPYFQPEPRDKFFEPGTFSALPLDRLAYVAERLPVPSLSLEGNAISYFREDAERIAVRPKLTDPILAYREHGAGYVGVFTSEFPDEWIEGEEGSKAITAWVKRLAAYQARDRYDFKLVDQGTVMDMTVALVPKLGSLLRVNRLSVALETDAQAATNLLLREVPDVPATFQGLVEIPRQEEAQEATLIIEESGPDELARPQRIPILIPPVGTLAGTFSAEAYSYGLNQPLLQAIAQVGGGLYAPEEGTPFFQSQPPERRSEPLWPWFLVAAVLAYLAAIAIRRLDV
ncbi:MAG: VWA domain-containing protein [Chloroflexota bacterium]